jgi:hypothetical protein
VNFTRDPIVLSVVTPKEGCRILIRNSKGSEREDYFADAVEIVSFEGTVFFRSSEKPKPFLIPASDFEILEVKETKMVLKSVSINKSIKISGGKQQPPPKPSNSTVEQNTNKPSSEESSKKRSRRSRRRPYSEEEKKSPPTKDVKKPETKEIKEHPIVDEAVTNSILKKLFPPPSTLIKEKLSQYKEQYPSPIKEEDGLLIEEETHDEDIVTKEPKAPELKTPESKTPEPKTPESKILDISEEKEKIEQETIKDEIKKHNEKVVDIKETTKVKETKKDIEKKKIDEKNKKDEKDTGLENKD